MSQLKKDGSCVDVKSLVSNAVKCFVILGLSVSKVEVLEGSIGREHLVMTCTLSMNIKQITTDGLMGCGAMGIPFIDHDFTGHHQTVLQES